MGWSCSKDASDVMQRWTAACIRQSGQQNVFYSGTKKYFWEVSNVEHDDGAITGSIIHMLNDHECRKVGTFRINGDGSISRAPKYLRQVSS
jgi:hypothetical protein